MAVAKKLVAGKIPQRIAEEIGISKQHVQVLAAEPETQFLITKALEPHRRKLEAMAPKAIAAVETALRAKKTDRADYKNRMAAVSRYGDLLELAQGGQRTDGKGGPQAGQFSVTQIYEILSLTQVNNGKEEDPK